MTMPKLNRDQLKHIAEVASECNDAFMVKVEDAGEVLVMNRDTFVHAIDKAAKLGTPNGVTFSEVMMQPQIQKPFRADIIDVVWEEDEEEVPHIYT